MVKLSHVLVVDRIRYSSIILYESFPLQHKAGINGGPSHATLTEHVRISAHLIVTTYILYVHQDITVTYCTLMYVRTYSTCT